MNENKPKKNPKDNELEKMIWESMKVRMSENITA
jgi:hypothetical protein